MSNKIKQTIESREIKFRAWDKEFNQMTTGNWLNDDTLMINFDGQLFSIDNDGQCSDVEDDRFILMQYTGLKDKNGVEIYEGDIIEIFNRKYIVCFGVHEIDVPTNKYSEYVSIVGFYLENDCGLIENIQNLVDDNKTVVGNIYENPELIQD